MKKIIIAALLIAFANIAISCVEKCEGECEYLGNGEWDCPCD